MRAIEWSDVALFMAIAITMCAFAKCQIERERNWKELELAKMQHKPSIEIQP